MFTGLIEEVGRVCRLERHAHGGRLTVAARKVLVGTQVGDSMAVSGACLTVVEISSDGFTVDVMPETLARTTLGRAAPGMLVNLERAVALGQRLGGHFVLGHVDAVGKVLAVRRSPSAWEVTFSLPASIETCVAPKGSIAVDGISLTVIGVRPGEFDVGLIPHTLKETSLRALRVGQEVNLEADVLARYVRRALEVLRLGEEQTRQDHAVLGSSGLTEELLREQGFI